MYNGILHEVEYDKPYFKVCLNELTRNRGN